MLTKREEVDCESAVMPHSFINRTKFSWQATCLTWLLASGLRALRALDLHSWKFSAGEKLYQFPLRGSLWYIKSIWGMACRVTRFNPNYTTKSSYLTQIAEPAVSSHHTHTLSASPNWMVNVVPVGPSAKSCMLTLESPQRLQEMGKGGPVTTRLVLHRRLAAKVHKKENVGSILSSRPEYPFLCRALPYL